MINITIAQLKSDVGLLMKGTSINQIRDFYGTVAMASRRMMGRVDLQEVIRIATLTSPFYDNVNDYALMTDYGGMIDIRPQANRIYQPGRSIYSETTPRQFLSRLDQDSFSIRYNNGIRALRAQVLRGCSVITMDTFDSLTGAGSWSGETDASGLYIEPLNYVEGSGSLGFNLSGATGAGDIVNTTAPITDLSADLYEDASVLFVWIPLGTSVRFSSFNLRRGSSVNDYKQVIVTTKADGTAFTDGWNQLLFSWSNATNAGSPDNTKNTYRRFGVVYTTGAAINGVLVDNWTDSLGQLYEAEYYSECMFRNATTGAWQYFPLDDTDIISVGPLSYEILKAEMMVDVTKMVRTGEIQVSELADWRLQLNGQPQTRYVKDPPYHGLYGDYASKFPSSRIVTRTQYYQFDI